MCVILIYLCCIQNVHDFAEDWSVYIVTFLADDLNVSQLSKVEVSFFLQSVYSHFQIQQLDAGTDGTKVIKRQVREQINNKHNKGEEILNCKY